MVEAGIKDMAQTSTLNSSNIMVVVAVMEEVVAILAQISPVVGQQIWGHNTKGPARQIAIKTEATVSVEVLPCRMLLLILLTSSLSPRINCIRLISLLQDNT